MKSIIIMFFCFFCSLLNSFTYHINQDGTGDFTTIQEGINASADTDTVLVHPGTYYENIDFGGKSITVASLYLTTGNDQYINQTTINGNQTGSCVRIVSEEDETTLLCGFTLINGSGSPYYEDGPNYGGGVLLIDTQVSIKSCSIKNNKAENGGGIYCMSSQITLSGVDIVNNKAIAGGGLLSRTDSEIIFDQNELCNIYLNYSGFGCEIMKAWSSPPMEVYVDTFTVFESDSYFIYSATSTGIPLNDVTLNMQNAKLESVNSDLYVSTDGNNNNNGLTPDEPLKNINFALSLVKSDTLHPNTIHISDGTYSHTLNNDYFPLNMRGYVSLEGESMENVILDAEENAPHIYDRYSKLDYSINNLTLTNGTGTTVSSIVISVYQQYNKFVNFENITITDCFSYTKNMKLFYMDLSIKNIHSYSNNSTLLWALNSFQSEQEVIIENAYIHDNHQYDPASMSSDASPQLSFGMLGTEPMNVTITNMELTENIQTQSDWPKSVSGILVGDDINLNLVNCTIGNNSAPVNGGAIIIGHSARNSEINIYNSILYGDVPREIYIDNESSANPSTLNIQNSLVHGGEEGISNPYSWNVINWNEGNLNEDPFWDVSGNNPYALMENSPCINAGTLDLPEGIELPEYDLAGNPRIVNSMIDLGAYEFQDSVAVSNENLQSSILKIKLSNYPNPFNPITKISFSISKNCNINLSIFNIKGQKIKTLINEQMQGGKHSVIWSGLDDANKPVSSGIYLCKIKSYKNESIMRMMLLK